MISKTFTNSEKTEAFNVFISPNCELVNPVAYFGDLIRKQSLKVDLSFFEMANLRPSELQLRKLRSNALDFWQEKYKEAVQFKLQTEATELLTWKKKRDQERLAGELSFNSQSMFAFLIQAGDTFKYKYSRYVTEYMPKEYANRVFPKFIYQESKDKFITQGRTDLSFRELEVTLEKRRRVIAEFLDNGKEWHCFFRTMLSITGKEEPHLGEPHIHYLSSNWNIKREHVVEQLQSYRYKLPSISIPFVKEN